MLNFFKKSDDVSMEEAREAMFAIIKDLEGDLGRIGEVREEMLKIIAMKDDVQDWDGQDADVPIEVAMGVLRLMDAFDKLKGTQS